MLIDRSFSELTGQAESDPVERRGNPRIPFEGDVSVGGGGRVQAGVSINVSSGGIFVATFRPIVEGTHVSVRFRLPTGQVVASGVVRWTREARPGLMAGLGVEFVEMSELDRVALVAFCGNRPRFLSYDEIVGAANPH